MTSIAHAAFRRNPTAARGVVCARDFSPLVLTGCVVDVAVQWMHARVTVRQEFISCNAGSVETFAAYNSVPGFDLVSFRCDIGDRSVFTEVKKPPIVDGDSVASAVDDGESAPRVFTAKIPGQVHARQGVLVTLVFVAPVTLVGAHTVLFMVPKELLPARVDPPSSEWRAAFDIKTNGRIPNRFIFTAKGTLYGAAAGAPLAASWMQGASCKLLGDPRRFEVSFEDRGNATLAPKSDLSFSVAMVPDEDAVSVQVIRDTATYLCSADRYAALVSLQPRFTEEQRQAPNVEVVFLLDASGSMAPHAPALKSALRAAIAGLPKSCYVNAVAFEDELTWLFPDGSEQIGATGATAVANFVESYAATSPHTRLYNALRQAYERPSIRGVARVLALVTDGVEWRQPLKLLELVAANTHSTRVVSVGVGAHADATLLRALADASGGVFAPAATSADIAGALIGGLAETVVPTLVGAALRFSYDGVDEAPPLRASAARLPLIPDGRRHVSYALGDEALRGFTAQITGACGASHAEHTVHSGDVRQAESITSTASDPASRSLLHVAAAAARIRTLVDCNARSVLLAAEDDEVVRLSSGFSLLAPQTRLVAAGNTSAEAGKRLVLVAYAPDRARFVVADRATLPSYRDASGVAVDPDVAECNKAAKAAAAAAATCRTQGSGAPTTATYRFFNRVVHDVVSVVCDPPSVGPILAAQEHDGSWKPTQQVLRFLERGAADVAAAKPSEADETLWATALVKLFLEVRFGGPETRLAVKKAGVFIATATTPVVANALFEGAKIFL